MKDLNKNLKRTSIFFIIFLICNSGFANKIDSLKSLLIEKKSAEIYNQLAYEYLQISPDSARIYATQSLISKDKVQKGDAYRLLANSYLKKIDSVNIFDNINKAIELYNEIGNKEGLAKAYSIIGKYYYNVYDIENSRANYEISYNLYKEIDDENGISSVLLEFGNMHTFKNEFNKALEYLNKSYKISLKEKNLNTQTRAQLSIGNVYSKIDSISDAIVVYKRALALSRKTGNILHEGIALLNLGVINYNLNRYDKTIDYYQSALKLFKEINSETHIGLAKLNLSSVYVNLGQFQKALELSLKALSIFKETKDKHKQGLCLNNIGVAYYNLDKTEESLKHFNKALLILEEIGTNDGVPMVLNNIGNIHRDDSNYSKAVEIYKKGFLISKLSQDEALLKYNYGLLHYKNKDYNEALKLYQESLELCSILKIPRLRSIIYKSISDLYEARGNTKKAFEAYKMHKVYYDSTRSDEINQRITAIEVETIAEIKEQKIEVLNKESEVQSLKLEQESRLNKIFIIASLILLLFIIILIINYYKLRFTHNKLLEKNIEIVEKQEEITRIIENKEESTLIPYTQEITDNQEDYQKYKSSALDDEKKEELINCLLDLIDKEKIYLDSNLTIDIMSDKLDTNKTYLSQTINATFNKNFSNFINEYRVKDARKILISEEAKRYTIEGIAKKVGFNSRTTFLTAFKKYTGLAPAHFIKAMNVKETH
jgi:tetratricopeptide (TPR) repeat protein